MRRPLLSAIAALCAAALVLPGAGSAAAAPGGSAGTDGASADTAGKPDKKLRQQLRQANKWAQKASVKQQRVCRTGNNYAYRGPDYGAYGLSTKVWRKFGGAEFAKRADKASRAQQDYIARKYVRKAGLSAVGCDFDDWMGRVYAKAGKTPLSQMLIPGTHDAGTAGIRTQAPCSTQFVNDVLFPILSGWSAQNPCVFASLYESQNLTLEQQLRRGVRYLDLRVGIPEDQVLTAPPPGPAADPAAVPLVLSHKLVSVPLAEALAGVQRFVAKHPREQIILDFQEFNLPRDAKKPVDPTITAYYKDALDRLLRTYAPGGGVKPICSTAWSGDVISTPDDRLGRSVPIKRAWREGVSVVVYFKAGEKPSADPCFRSRWAAGSFLYPNTDDPAKSTSDNLGYLRERKQRLASGDCLDAVGNNYCDVNVSQLQLTPPLSAYGDCVKTPQPDCSLRHYSSLVNDDIVSTVRRWRFGAEKLPVNIAMVDYIDESDPRIADGLIASNWRIARG